MRIDTFILGINGSGSSNLILNAFGELLFTISVFHSFDMLCFSGWNCTGSFHCWCVNLLSADSLDNVRGPVLVVVASLTTVVNIELELLSCTLHFYYIFASHFVVYLSNSV